MSEPWLRFIIEKWFASKSVCNLPRLIGVYGPCPKHTVERRVRQSAKKGLIESGYSLEAVDCKEENNLRPTRNRRGLPTKERYASRSANVGAVWMDQARRVVRKLQPIHAVAE